MHSGPSPQRLLAINFGGLGDEVLFLPTLQSIKSKYPSLHITLLTEPRARSITQVTNLVDDNITFDIKKKPLKPADFIELVQLIRRGKYQTVLSSGGSPQVAALLFICGIPQRIGYGSNQLARLLLTNPIPLNKEQHACFMYHDLAKGLGVQGAAARPQIITNERNIAAMEQLLSATESGITASPRKRVLLHPGTSKMALQKGIIKTWPPASWVKLIERLLEEDGIQVVLAGGPDDEETVKEILASLPENAKQGRFLNACGKTAGLPDLVALIQLSDLIVCVDSAPMHLAVGLNKSLVALFGRTDPEKLLWPDKKFIALRDPADADYWKDKDPFATQLQNSSSQPAPFVRIPLDTVFQTVMDQLNSTATRDSSRESR